MMALKEAIEKVDKAIKHADEVAAKLTTKQRKNLKSSTFCGPNRSFPVNDCAHVRAAKVYLKRSKFSADVQKRIAACINRKAKALGCPGTIPAKSKGAVDADLQKILDSKIFNTTKELVDASMENEGMELDFTGCEDCE
jgi:hypothetical protein